MARAASKNADELRNRVRTFVPPMGVAKAYALDTIDNTGKDQSSSVSSSSNGGETSSSVEPSVQPTRFSGGFADITGLNSLSGNVATPGDNRLNVKVDVPATKATPSKPPPIEVVLNESPNRSSGTSGARAPSAGSIENPGGMYAKLDDASKKATNSPKTALPMFEPKVIMDQSEIRTYRKVPLPPNLGVVMGTSPPPRSTVLSSPSPEMKVVLERSIPKQVDPPPADTADASNRETAPPPLASAAAKAPSPPEANIEMAQGRSSEDIPKKTERESIPPETMDYIKG